MACIMGNFLMVRGQGFGGTKGVELGRLGVEVKWLKSPFVQFFLVSDKDGHKTSFTESDTKDWPEFANSQVFDPQINARFKHLRTKPIDIDEDLGNKINFRSIGLLPYVKREDEAGRLLHKITDFGMLEPQFLNVFCVWDFDNDSDEGLV